MNRGPVVNFIGIGAQKCASSWVHKVLAEHPQAHLSTPKELDYFSYFWGRGHDWYERFFAGALGARLVGDNSPSYFVHPLAAERAARYNPRLKIVVALRDPVERAFSNHLHMVREGFLAGPDLSFEYGLARNEMYVEQSRYATHLRRWLDHFPREQVFVVLQEELGTGDSSVTRRLYAFLGLDASYVPASAGRTANISATPRSAGADAALRGTADLARRVGLARLVSAVKASAAVQRARAANQVNLREIVAPMHPETRAHLEALLADEVMGLCRVLGRTALPWPTFDAIRNAEAVRPPAAVHVALETGP